MKFRPVYRLSGQRGFTLIEVAMVMLIMALLLGSLLAPLTAQIDQQKITETKKSLAEIREALIGFAIINGRLPCPSDKTTASGSVNAGGIEAGKEVLSCTTDATNSGVVPWVTLGVRETDAWGRRFTYRVNSAFATNAPFFSLTSLGTLDVYSTASGATPACPADFSGRIATNVPAIIISHGKNGFGAYTSQGGAPMSTTGADVSEKENADVESCYMEKEIDLNPSTAPTYDDVLIWIPPTILFNRMVAAGKLP